MENNIINQLSISIDKQNHINHESIIIRKNLKHINKRIHSQDFKQGASVFILFLIEIYRALTASLLLIFVPQSCFIKPCTLSENNSFKTHLYAGSLIINYITLSIFLVLYGIEIMREIYLIKYLDVNDTLPNDLEDVNKRLLLL